MDRQSTGIRIAWYLVVGWLFVNPVVPAGFGTSTIDRGELDESNTDLDLTSLESEAARRFPSLTSQQLHSLTVDSFRSVFFSKLNRSRMLVAPQPEFVVEKVAELFEAYRELEAALQEGTEVIVGQESIESQRSIVDRIEKSAEQIKGLFDGYFRETFTSRMTVRLPVVTDRLAQFSLFLNEARKLVARLSAELTLYFFNTHPGLVSVSEFQSRTSVTVLSELLIEISRKAESRW